GRVTAAEEQLDAAMRLPVRLQNVRVEQIRVLRESGRSAEAVEASRQMFAEDPGSDDAAYEYGLSLLADGRPGEAEPYLRRAAEKAPANKFARAHHGVALLATGRAAGADVEFRAAAALDPDYPNQLIRTARRTALTPDANPSNLRPV